MSQSQVDLDNSQLDLESFSLDQDTEEILSPQALNEHIVYPHLIDLLEYLPETGYARVEFLKNYARVLLVLDTTWSCPLVTQAFTEAQAAILEAKAQIASY